MWTLTSKNLKFDESNSCENKSIMIQNYTKKHKKSGIRVSWVCFINYENIINLGVCEIFNQGSGIWVQT